MPVKRLYFGLLLVTALLIVTGCATTDKADNPTSSRYKMASDECIRFGHRRDSYDYKRCVEKRLNPGEKTPSSEGD